MTELLLIALLGAGIREQISLDDCHQLIGAAMYARQIGGEMSRDGVGIIRSLECDGIRVELPVTPSQGPCEEPVS